MDNIEAYKDCMGTRSTATALQSGNSLAMSIILWAMISLRYLLPGDVGLPVAASTTEIKDSLDFETIVRHYLGNRGRISSHHFAKDFILFVSDMGEGRNRREVVMNEPRRSSSSLSAGRG